MGQSQRLAALLVLAALGSSCVEAVRPAYADYLFHQQTDESMRAALRIDPENADYWARLGRMLATENEGAARKCFETAAALNPRDAKIRIELGLLAEADKDFQTAERCLRSAAEADRRYTPRWTLVNFYFRRGRLDDFWYWARASLEMVHDDPAPLFKLCWSAAGDGDYIDRKLESRRPEVAAAYLRFLSGNGHTDRLESAAGRLLQFGRAADTPVLREACDRLLRDGDADGALRIWNNLCRCGRIPYSALEPERGLSVTNGDFAAPPSGDGFDWRLRDVRGVSTTILEDRGGVEFRFSGSQPESCELMTQVAPVLPGIMYELRVQHSTAGIRPGSGLELSVDDPGSGILIGEQPAVLRFRTPPGKRLMRIAFAYRRAPGTTRIEGTLRLRAVEMRPLGKS